MHATLQTLILTASPAKLARLHGIASRHSNRGALGATWKRVERLIRITQGIQKNGMSAYTAQALDEVLADLRCPPTVRTVWVTALSPVTALRAA